MVDIKAILSPTRMRRFWTPPSRPEAEAAEGDVGPRQLLNQLRAAISDDLGADADMVAPVLDLIELLLPAEEMTSVELDGLSDPDTPVTSDGMDAGMDDYDDDDDDDDDELDAEGDDLPFEEDLMGLLDQLEDLLEAVQIWKRRDLGGAP